MKINRRLNIVIPFEGGTVHSTPISRDVFERYFVSISKAFAAIYGEGLGVLAGPRVSALLLKRVAKDSGEWDGPEGVENGLMNEVRRLSNVIITDEGNGWRTISLHTAIIQNMIDEDQISEIENALVFFTCASAMHKSKDQPGVLNGAGSLWGMQTTLLDCTEYQTSLQTLKAQENIGEKVTLSSIPS